MRVLRDLGAFIVTVLIAGCEMQIVDCAQIDQNITATGRCATTGTVSISEDYALTLIIMDNGNDAAISLYENWDLQNGDRIKIEADYYASEGKMSLVRNAVIERISEP